jgi:uncharacterized protein YjiS (DUF1127 family)
MTRRQFRTTGSIECRTLPAAALSSAGSCRALLVNSIKQLIAWIRSTDRMRRAIHELMALDDRILADISLSRGGVMYAARHGSLLNTLNAGEFHVASSR